MRIFFFEPTNADVGSYTVEILLTDTNIAPKSNTYKLKIKVLEGEIEDDEESPEPESQPEQEPESEIDNEEQENN